MKLEILQNKQVYTQAHFLSLAACNNDKMLCNVRSFKREKEHGFW